jgi:hypothetical protein
MLDKKTILNADDLPREQVVVPQWGGEVFVRTLTGTERDEFEQSCLTSRGKNKEMNLKNIRARLCVLCICQEDGTRLFDARDVEALGKKSSSALDLIFSVAQKLNGLSGEDTEELAGN